MADWSGLPEDLLLVVVPRLHVLDLLHFRAVCASWRAAAREFALRRGRPRPDRPWLLLPTADEASHHQKRLLVSSDREIPSVTLPTRVGRGRGRRRFVPLGSARGMLVAADDLGAMHLLDLVTGGRAPLPPVATLPLVEGVERDAAGGLRVRYRLAGEQHPPAPRSLNGIREELLHKVIPIPTPDGKIMVVAMYRQQRNQWATAHPGDRAWKSVAPTSIPGFPALVDVVMHKGQLYANTRYGLTYAFPELRGLGSASPEIIPSVTRRPNSYVDHSYLVESPSGDLMQLEWLRPVAGGGEGSSNVASPEPNVEFVVRVLDDCSDTWEETDDVGEVTMFVDTTSAVTASTMDCPGLRANCVYFTGDLDGETRVWAYDLAGKKMEVVQVLAKTAGYEPPCCWYTPVYSQGSLTM